MEFSTSALPLSYTPAHAGDRNSHCQRHSTVDVVICGKGRVHCSREEIQYYFLLLHQGSLAIVENKTVYKVRLWQFGFS
jgi:hypothetical protein